MRKSGWSHHFLTFMLSGSAGEQVTVLTMTLIMAVRDSHSGSTVAITVATCGAESLLLEVRQPTSLAAHQADQSSTQLRTTIHDMQHAQSPCTEADEPGAPIKQHACAWRQALEAELTRPQMMLMATQKVK